MLVGSGWYSQHASTINPSHIDQLLSTALSSCSFFTTIMVEDMPQHTAIYTSPKWPGFLAVKIPGIKCCKMLQDAGIMNPAKGLSSTGRPLMPSAAKARK